MMLQPGDKVPEFEAKDQDGNTVYSKDWKGKKHVLFFYPHDLTETCTNEACNLRDGYHLLKKEGYEVIGISTDDEKTHRKFIAKYQLPFTLIADTDQNAANIFGVWGRKKFMGREFDGMFRTTFLIDENLVISHIFEKVKSKTHTMQILDALTNK